MKSAEIEPSSDDDALIETSSKETNVLSEGLITTPDKKEL